MNFHFSPAKFLFWVTISSFNMVKKIAGRLCEDAESSFYFILILGYLDVDTGYKIEDIIKYLKNQLKIVDLKKV